MSGVTLLWQHWGLVMDYDSGNDIEYSTEEPSVGFAADAYEQIKVLRERRKLVAAEQRKYESLRTCLELKKQLLEAKTKLASINLAKAEAERDCAQTLRLARKDRRRELRLRKNLVEVKEQTALQMQSLVNNLHDAVAEAQTEREKTMYLEHAVLLDAQTAEFLACPKCGTHMEYDDISSGRICPVCLFRPTVV